MRQKKLEEFLKEVIKLTVYHHVLDGYAVVYPCDLNKAIEKVNPNWFEEEGE